MYYYATSSSHSTICLGYFCPLLNLSNSHFFCCCCSPEGLTLGCLCWPHTHSHSWVPMLTTQSIPPQALLYGHPSRGPSTPRALSLITRNHRAYRIQLVPGYKGLLQHLHAQIHTDLEFPASKLAPDQEQRRHLQPKAARVHKGPGPGQGGWWQGEGGILLSDSHFLMP